MTECIYTITLTNKHTGEIQVYHANEYEVTDDSLCIYGICFMFADYDFEIMDNSY